MDRGGGGLGKKPIALLVLLLVLAIGNIVFGVLDFEVSALVELIDAVDAYSSASDSHGIPNDRDQFVRTELDVGLNITKTLPDGSPEPAQTDTGLDTTTNPALPTELARVLPTESNTGQYLAAARPLRDDETSDITTRPVQTVPTRLRSDPSLAPTLVDGGNRYTSSSVGLSSIGTWPVCEYRHICAHCKHGDKGGCVLSVAKEYNMQGRFAELDGYPVEMCKPLHGQSMFIPILHHEHVDEGKWMTVKDVIWLPKTTFLIDTYLFSPHFGHVVSKVVQFQSAARTVMRDPESLQIDRMFMLLQGRYPSEKRPMHMAVTQMVVASLPERFLNISHSVYRTDCEKSKTICMERALEIRQVYERKFSSSADVLNWVSFLETEMKPWERNFENTSIEAITPFTQRSKCPKIDAPVIYLIRTEGQGRRNITNLSVLQRVLLDLGIGCDTFRIASVSSHSTLRDQARLFHEYALLISSHGTQLTNVLFSHPLSATLEVRPDHETYDSDVTRKWHRFPSPFCVDLVCSTVYAVSPDHRPGKHYREDFDVNPNVLKRDLSALMERQKLALTEAGCPLLNIHSGTPSKIK